MIKLNKTPPFKLPYLWVVEARDFGGKGWQPIFGASYQKMRQAKDSAKYMKNRFPVEPLRVRKYTRSSP